MGWFAWKGAPGAMWECTVEFTGAYARMSVNPLATGWLWFKTFGGWKAAAIVGLTVGGAVLRRRDGGLFWGAVFAVALGVAMADANRHYYVMALPLAAMGAGAGIDWAASRSGKGGGWAGAACVAAVWAALLTGNERLALRCTPRQLSEGLYRGNPFVEAEEAGKLVSRLCGEDETVHVVGSEPEILWYARRRGTTRFDIAYPMTLRTEFAERYQREAAEALRKNEAPGAVVLAMSRMGAVGDSALIEGYLRTMAGTPAGVEYRLAWAHVAGLGGWKAGGEWGAWHRAGASLGIWQKAETTGPQGAVDERAGKGNR